jgi:hypothetical protein
MTKGGAQNGNPTRWLQRRVSHLLARPDDPIRSKPIGYLLLFPACEDPCCCSRSWLKAASKAWEQIT